MLKRKVRCTHDLLRTTSASEKCSSQKTASFDWWLSFWTANDWHPSCYHGPSTATLNILQSSQCCPDSLSWQCLSSRYFSAQLSEISHPGWRLSYHAHYANQFALGSAVETSWTCFCGYCSYWLQLIGTIHGKLAWCQAYLELHPHSWTYGTHSCLRSFYCWIFYSSLLCNCPDWRRGYCFCCVFRHFGLYCTVAKPRLKMWHPRWE